MRTTLSIDDDVLAAARSLAAAEKRSLGEILSELARRGLRTASPERWDRGFPVFDVEPDARSLTAETVRRALEEPSARARRSGS